MGKVIEAISTGASAARDLLFPQTCLICGELVTWGEKGGACGKCRNEWHFLDMEIDYGKRLSFCREWVSLTEYEGGVREWIHGLKYGNRPDIAREMAKITFSRLKNVEFMEKADIIAAVPLHKNRLISRGYNQAEIYARELSRLYDIPYAADILIRVKETTKQAGLGPIDRRKNIEDAFEIGMNPACAGKSIILTDDLITTGFTLNECASVLKRHGAGNIVCLTFAAALTKDMDK